VGCSCLSGLRPNEIRCGSARIGLHDWLSRLRRSVDWHALFANDGPTSSWHEIIASLLIWKGLGYNVFSSVLAGSSSAVASGSLSAYGFELGGF
jgi:hypothetical protein